MSSEFLVKQTLIKIIENAKFDYEKENYKWFKLNFLNDDRKSFAGDYDMRTHIIRVFVPKTSAKTNANLICTTLHEVSHHIDWCNRHTSDHSDAFYEIFQKLLYSAMDLNVVSVSDIKNYKLQKYVENYINNIDLSEYINKNANPKLTQEKLNSIMIYMPNDTTLDLYISSINQCDKLKFEAQERLEKLTIARKELIDKHFR